MKAVRQNGLALYFAKKHIPEICIEAEKHNRKALEYVKDQTLKYVCESSKTEY